MKNMMLIKYANLLNKIVYNIYSFLSPSDNIRKVL